MSNNLQELLTALDFKTPPDEIPEDLKNSLIKFLVKEKDFRHQWKIRRLLASSGIRPHQLRTFDQFQWNFNPGFPKEDVLAFRNSSWIDNGANLILIGDPGLGKSHIAKALCYDAIQKGHSAHFITAFDLISKIKRNQNMASRIEYYGSTLHVLAIDEDPPRGWLDEACDQAERRGLAATRRPEQGQELALEDREVQRVHGADAAVILGAAPELDDGPGHDRQC